MQQPHRWVLSALVSLGVAVGCAPAQAATLLDRGLGAESLTLTPEASSPPEFGRCIKTTGGAYKDAGCIETGSSEKAYEWYPAFGSAHPLEKTGFSNALKEATLASLETVGTMTVSCEGESSTGKYTGNKTIGSVVVSFLKCTASGSSCQSAGSPSGTIVTNSLEGVLGVEELAAEPVNYKIGEDLFPPGRSGSIASFSCGGIGLSISGSIISRVVTNSMRAMTQIKTKASEGKQKPESFVGETPDVLMTHIEGGASEQAGETLTTVQTNEEKIEVNSVT
jgi:hypothetical protein